MKKVLQLGIGCLISAVAMYIAFREVKLTELSESFSQIQWWPVLPFLACFGAHFFFRSLRWRYLLPEPQGERPSLRKLFDSMILGNLATFLLPFRLGEFIRPMILSRWSEYSFASAFISVVIERFFDLAGVLIAFAIIVPMLPAVPEWVNWGAYSLGALSGCLLLFLICGCLFPSFIRSSVILFTKPLPQRLASLIVQFAGDLIGGAAVIKTPMRLLTIVVLTGVVWLFAWLQFYSLLFIFPYDHSFLLSVTLGVFVALAIAFPSAPGFLGVFQVGCVAACSFFTFPPAAATTYSIVVHMLTYLLFIGIGFWLLAIHDLSLGELRNAAEDRGEAPIPPG